MNTIAEKLAKLPQWAKDHIARIERDRDDWRDKALAGSVADSNVVYSLRHDDEFGLPTNTRVKFKLQETKHYVEVGHSMGWGNKIDPNLIEVRGFDAIVVMPGCSNVVYVKADKR